MVANIEDDFKNDQDKFESAANHELLVQKKIQEKIDFTDRKMKEFQDERQAQLNKIEGSKNKDSFNWAELQAKYDGLMRDLNSEINRMREMATEDFRSKLFQLDDHRNYIENAAKNA